MGAIDLIALLVQCASGVAGGNLGASLLRSLNLGVVGNSLSGLIGGGIGTQLVDSSLRLAATPALVEGPDPGTLVALAAGGGVGGAAMALLVGLLTKLGRAAT
jgi:hypothetical protein